MDHLSDCEFCRDDSHARSFLTDLRKIILRVFAISEFSHSLGHEQTNRPRQRRVCLYSVNRPQSRRKQAWPRRFQGRTYRERLPSLLARQPGAGSFLKLSSNKLICRAERAKARLRMQNPALANYATATLLASSKGLGCSLDKHPPSRTEANFRWGNARARKMGAPA
jgi:hypothetical protein